MSTPRPLEAPILSFIAIMTGQLIANRQIHLVYYLDFEKCLDILTIREMYITLPPIRITEESETRNVVGHLASTNLYIFTCIDGSVGSVRERWFYLYAYSMYDMCLTDKTSRSMPRT